MEYIYSRVIIKYGSHAKERQWNMFTFIQVMTGNLNPFAIGLCVLSDVIFSVALWWHYRLHKK